MNEFVQVNKNSSKANTNPIGYIVRESGCWEWVGAISKLGYGSWWCPEKKRVMGAHRRMYEVAVGVIPKGLDIDHLCRNRCCVNPAHLEAVTEAENVRRSMAPGAVARRTGVCQRGHSDWIPRRDGNRRCRVCDLALHKEYKRIARRRRGAAIRKPKESQ